MGRRKYLSDYRLPEPGEAPDARSAYTGVYFVFPDPAMPANRRVLPLLTLLGWLGFFAGVIPRSAGAVTAYAVLPLVFSALPLGRAALAIPALRRTENAVVRSDAERISGALPTDHLWMLILGAAALAGEGFLALVRPEKLLLGDAVFALGAAAVAAAGAMGFARRRTLRCQERR